MLAPSSRLVIIIAEESEHQQRIAADLRDADASQLLAVCNSVDEFIESRMDAYVSAVIIALRADEQRRFISHRDHQEKIYPIINIELPGDEEEHIDWSRVPISESIAYKNYRTDLIRMTLKYITELNIVLGEVKALQQSVMDAEQTNSRFFQYMSHELSTPLHAARNLQKNADHIDSVDGLHEIAQITKTALTHVLDAINNITEYSRLNSNQVPMITETVDIRSQIDELLVLFNSHAEHKKINLCAEYASEEEVLYHGDPLRLRQVLVNLVKNAVKFTDEGEIRIYVDNRESTLTVSVCDTGIGMSPERLHEIHSSDTYRPSASEQGGLGLGLKISREFLYKSGGHLEIESEVGKGSKFSISLPNLYQSGSRSPDQNRLLAS